MIAVLPGVGDSELTLLMEWADDAIGWFRQPGGEDT